MNTILLLIVAIPIAELITMIKLGGEIGALNTVLLIFFTAIVGVYFARIQSLNTLKAGLSNIYQNKTPIYELISGASIAISAALLIFPGFITDFFGFLLLIPLTRRIFIKIMVGKSNEKNVKKENKEEIIEEEIVEKNKDKNDEI